MTSDAKFETHANAPDAAGGWIDVEPVPRRFWWLKRLLILAAAMFVALLALRLWWGHVAEIRLDDQIAEYRAAGQLVYAEEFDAQLDAIPDEENAAVLYEAAMAKIVHTTTSGIGYADFVSDESLFDSDPDAARELFESNREVFRLVRQARDRPQIAWTTRLQGFLHAPSGLGSNQRDLSKLMSFAVTYQFNEGDHASAIETLQDFLQFSEHVASFPTLISNLVSWACTALAISNIQDHSACLDVQGGRADANLRARQAPPAQLRKVIQILLAEGAQRGACSRAYLGERVHVHEMARAIRRGTLSQYLRLPRQFQSSLKEWWLAPRFELDLVRCSRFQTILSEAVSEPTYSRADRRLAPLQDVNALATRLVRPYSRITAPSQQYSVSLYFRLLAERRMAATALAIRLYEVDHGHRPAELSALVPDYLPSVPLDPFAEDGLNIRYRLSPEPTILYSLGPDGQDDGGVPRRPYHYNDYDIVFYLDGEPE